MTKIEWTDKVWNPVTGCTKVSAGCKNCYAARLFPWTHPGRKFTDVQCHADRLDQPLHWRKPRRVFVNSMSDLFHPDVPVTFQVKIMCVIEKCPQHQFQILTKRPERMKEFFSDSGPPKNVWLGVSVENQDEVWRIDELLQTPAAVRFVSCEPLLGPVDFDCYPSTGCPTGWLDEATRLDWVIVGGESGPGARPMNPDWARSIREQCQAAGVPYFFKQWGEWAPDCLCDISLSKRHSTTPRPQPGKLGCMFRCGKKRAGRMLDGRTWDEYPG